MDDNTVITNEYEQNEDKRPEKSLKVIFAVVIAALLVLFILLGIFFGKRAASRNEEQTTADAGIAETTEAVTQPPLAPAEKYKPGDYTVQSGYSLNLRKDHSTEAEAIMAIPENTKLTISEIYYDENAASEETMYWGKTTYKGWTAWISMFYTKKAYSDNVVEPEATTAAPAETTSSEQTTGASQPTGNPTTGKYKVTADSYLRIREDHNIDALSIGNVEKDRELEVLEVYTDSAATDETLKHWGRVSYMGVNGWVAMYYLEKIS